MSQNNPFPHSVGFIRECILSRRQAANGDENYSLSNSKPHRYLDIPKSITHMRKRFRTMEKGSKIV